MKMTMRKFTIGICDDMEPVCRMLKGLLEEIWGAKEWGIVCQWKIFLSGKALLDACEELDLVFLDLDMPQMDGIETGKQLNRLNPNCKIIVATSMIGRFKEAFLIHTFRFVTKPFQKEELEQVLTDYFNSLVGYELIELFYHRQPCQVLQREIHYIKACNGIECFTKGVLMRREQSIDKVMEILDEKIFFRINRKFCVNLLWAKIKDKENGIIQVDNLELKVSRRRRKELALKYLEVDMYYI